MTTRPGTQYRVKASHPRRPGTPLRITDRDGRFLVASGDTCGHLTSAQLESLIRQGFVEPIAEASVPPAKAGRRAGTTKGEDA